MNLRAMKAKIKEKIKEAGKVRFPGQKIAVRCPCGYTSGMKNIDGLFELLVGHEGEHCYAVVELEDGNLDFEQRD